jgi:hypothetical protein
MNIRDHTKLKTKFPFVPSGIPSQSFFIPMLFPSQNEWLRMAGSTYRPGARHQRGSDAQALKNTMENKIQLHLRLAKVQPMAQAFFLFTFYEAGRNRNKDNIQALALKFFFDALQKAGLLENDGWKEVAGWDVHFTVAKDQPPGMFVEMLDPVQCHQRIIHELSTRASVKVVEYLQFRKRTSR